MDFLLQRLVIIFIAQVHTEKEKNHLFCQQTVSFFQSRFIMEYVKKKSGALKTRYFVKFLLQDESGGTYA